MATVTLVTGSLDYSREVATTAVTVYTREGSNTSAQSRGGAETVGQHPEGEPLLSLPGGLVRSGEFEHLTFSLDSNYSSIDIKFSSAAHGHFYSDGYGQ